MKNVAMLTEDRVFALFFPSNGNLPSNAKKMLMPGGQPGEEGGWTPGGALGYFLGGYVPPGNPNWHPILKKISPKIDTPF